MLLLRVKVVRPHSHYHSESKLVTLTHVTDSLSLEL